MDMGGGRWHGGNNSLRHSESVTNKHKKMYFAINSYS